MPSLHGCWYHFSFLSEELRDSIYIYIYIYKFRAWKQNMEQIKNFFFYLISILSGKKKRDKSKFSWLAQFFKHIFLKFNPIWVRKKRNGNESMFCLTPKPSKLSLAIINKTKKNFFTEKGKMGRGGLNKRQKEDFWTALTMVVKKEPTTSIKNTLMNGK